MKYWLIARRIVQIAVLGLFSAPLLLSGWTLLGLTPGAELAVAAPSEQPFYGSLSASSIFGFVLLDPFATLEVIVASRSIEPNWLLASGVVVAFYALVGGRVFCGWACPVNLVLEFVDWLGRLLKLKPKERSVPRYTKIWVALGFLVIAAITTKPLFENLSPIAAIGKGILFGGLAGIITLVAIIVAELFFSRRIWCRALCPVGALYEVVGRISPLKVRIDKSRCTHCLRCQQVCLADPEILEPAITGSVSCVKAGDCLRCGVCIDECPEKALKLAIM